MSVPKTVPTDRKIVTSAQGDHKGYTSNNHRERSDSICFIAMLLNKPVLTTKLFVTVLSQDNSVKYLG